METFPRIIVRLMRMRVWGVTFSALNTTLERVQAIMCTICEVMYLHKDVSERQGLNEVFATIQVDMKQSQELVLQYVIKISEKLRNKNIYFTQ